MKKIISSFYGILLVASTLFAQEKPKGVLLNLYAADMAQPKGISENGKWACGSAFWSGNENQSGTINASKWNLETGERIYLVDDQELSDAYCISNDGTLIGGSYEGLPAYNLNGKWHILLMPARYENGYGDVVSMAFVGKDTIMSGYVYTSDFTRGKVVRWINGKLDNNFVYRNNLRWTEIDGREIESDIAKISGMSADGERYLISLDYNSMPTPGGTSLPTTFVQFGCDDDFTTKVIDRQFGDYAIISFVNEASMSHNGQWVCGRTHAIPSEASAAESTVGFIYNVDKDEFTYFDGLNNTGLYVAASCIDNAGRAYFKSTDGSPLGKPYINKDGEFIELEKCLLSYEGITANQIDAIAEEVEGSLADDLGIVWCVSADGKTLIGAGDALKGYMWCARLSCSPYDLDSYTAIENIQYNKNIVYYANGTISFSNNTNKCEIYSITGAKVLSSTVENNTLKVNLNKGIYIVKAFIDNNIITSKIIVK
jgi:hypothetical protein